MSIQIHTRFNLISRKNGVFAFEKISGRFPLSSSDAYILNQFNNFGAVSANGVEVGAGWNDERCRQCRNGVQLYRQGISAIRIQIFLENA